MSKRNFEEAIDQHINTMTLSHHKELLPIIFEMNKLTQYYTLFDCLDDSFYTETDPGKQSMCYHNKVHSQAVALNCYEAIYQTELPISTDEKRALLLAGLFHDARHGHGESSDACNIARAIDTLESAHARVKAQVSPEVLARAIKLIKYTQYPYVSQSRYITSYCALAIRDADLMMAYEPDNVLTNLHIGLFNEINHGRDNNYESRMTFEYFIDNNDRFLRNIKWNTRWAKNKAFNRNFPQRIKELKDKLIESNTVTT